MYTEDQQKLRSLIASGDQQNIELAFAISRTNNIDIPLGDYWELYDTLSEFDFDVKDLGQRLETNCEEIMIKELMEIKDVSFRGEVFGKFGINLSLLTNLRSLEFYHCDLNILPDCIKDIKNLISLSVWYTPVEWFPDFLCDCESLQNICFEHTKIKSIPVGLPKLQGLKRLIVSHTHIQQFPEVLLDMPLSTNIYINNTKIKTFPENLPSNIYN